ncbi:substrate-binding periplasmic protein [Aliamphritea hakodatensis]|uniref:substrate-binding periplasmic protein n=1 Tax=Aliamphritea hakodatensis TaxID=2895352 RepID=UPI0022FD78C7|nr:ABC transporter substrate-binding protein [Aliamphritea hakodatensis]
MRKLVSFVKAAAITMGAAVGSAFVQADTVDDIVSEGKIVVAVQTQGPPYSFIDKHGERTGFVIDLVKTFGHDIGVEIEFRDYEWKGLIPSLLSKKVDMIAADMTSTAKRSLKVSFTDPFMFSEVVAYTKSSSELSSWKQLNSSDYKIGAAQASSSSNYVKRFMPEGDLKEYGGGTPAVAQAITTGRIDAGVTELGIAQAMTRQFPELKILDGSILKSPLSFAVRPADTHLVAVLNNYFTLKQGDNTMDKLLDYWVRTDAWEKDHK